MKQYKNKRTGVILTKCANGNSYYSKEWEGYYIPKEFIENSCDWEEIVQLDYEIVSWVDEKGNVYENKEPVNTILGDGKFHITSVERLSDGEIFTINDKYRNGECCGGTITSFKVEDDTIVVNVCDYLKEIKKIKTPIFTTEDGVEIHNSWDKYYVPQKDSRGNLIGTILEFQAINFQGENDVKRFAKKEKAQEYIDLHQPKYSLQQIQEALMAVLPGGVNYVGWDKEFTKDFLEYLNN